MVGLFPRPRELHAFLVGECTRERGAETDGSLEGGGGGVDGVYFSSELVETCVHAASGDAEGAVGVEVGHDGRVGGHARGEREVRAQGGKGPERVHGENVVVVARRGGGRRSGDHAQGARGEDVPFGVVCEDARVQEERLVAAEDVGLGYPLARGMGEGVFVVAEEAEDDVAVVEVCATVDEGEHHVVARAHVELDAQQVLRCVGRELGGHEVSVREHRALQVRVEAINVVEIARVFRIAGRERDGVVRAVDPAVPEHVVDAGDDSGHVARGRPARVAPVRALRPEELHGRVRNRGGVQVRITRDGETERILRRRLGLRVKPFFERAKVRRARRGGMRTTTACARATRERPCDASSLRDSGRGWRWVVHRLSRFRGRSQEPLRSRVADRTCATQHAHHVSRRQVLVVQIAGHEHAELMAG